MSETLKTFYLGVKVTQENNRQSEVLRWLDQEDIEKLDDPTICILAKAAAIHTSDSENSEQPIESAPIVFIDRQTPLKIMYAIYNMVAMMPEFFPPNVVYSMAMNFRMVPLRWEDIDMYFPPLVDLPDDSAPDNKKRLGGWLQYCFRVRDFRLDVLWPVL